MPILRSNIDVRRRGFPAQCSGAGAQVADLRAKIADIAQGGDEAARKKHTARGKLLPRERVRGPARSGRAVPGVLPARGPQGLRGQYPRGRPDHRHRPGQRPGMRDRGQRRHGEGRHLLSADREEASARPGHRAREPAALHLSRRFRRRQSAEPGRGLPRPRSFRPHLLQPGDHVGARHSADRRGHGLLHRRRRLCAGDVRREHHRAQSGHDLPRRARRW